MKVTILGCGTSGGVPRIGGDWGACDPENAKNRRRRCSILVEQGDTILLVDTAPDLREQLLDAGVGRLDGMIYTHEHSDQVNGIDDLRVIAYNMRSKVEVYANAHTLSVLQSRFAHVFKQLPGSHYPAVAVPHTIDGAFEVGGIDVIPFTQRHGDIDSLGLRFGPIAYSNDVNELSEAAFAALEGVDTWIVDAMRYTPHPSHAHFDLALEWIARVAPRRAVLTNMHVDMDYDEVAARCPPGVEPAYDGMVIEAGG